MLFRCSLLLVFLSSVRTGYLNDNGLANSKQFDGSLSYSYWPSIHNAARMMKIRKREAEQVGQSEGGGTIVQTPQTRPVAAGAPAVSPKVEQQPVDRANLTTQTLSKSITSSSNKTQEENNVTVTPKGNVSKNGTETATAPLKANVTKVNVTVAESIDKVDLSGPGVVKRGVIVFGGFALLAAAYFIFYRRKGKKNDLNNTHNAIDANQFRYGVLQSEDRRDNMELSRVPLTMDSDEDEDDDLEIFDLEQKKKSLSYVNLQVNDEEVVNGPRLVSEDNERDNLLLDIEDSNTDPLINWSGNGNKSIL
ncbi:unnamed protein product [Chilo suppressalis]|uniref:Syndecan/Neurexin domain-containing protein n=1 Tax=Chilo suppressalis TaxID=168631 RepID=A0ABN8L0H3_CHISP|nr:unnamed protein product [Chilo suppressalis]